MNYFFNLESWMKPKIYVTRRLPGIALHKLTENCQVEIWDHESPAPPYPVIKANLKDKQGLLCLLTDRIDAELMDSAPGLKVISQCAVGYDNIDIVAARSRGLLLGHTPGVLTDATADLTFALVLAAARRLGEAVDYVKSGKWETWGLTILLGSQVYGKTLGILGLGRIGTALAKRARGFDMRILYHDKHRNPGAESGLGVEFCELEELFAQADFISLHVDLNESTEGMINAQTFRQMKPSGILINTSRGPVVNLDDLHRALSLGQIAYAALDVTDPEPLPPGHPILKLPNLIVVPHIASATVESRNRMALMAVDNLVAGLNGEPLPNPIPIN